MRFLSSLKSGVSIETAATEFVADLLEASWHINELCLESTCDFVHDVLKAIGLSCSITAEQIISGGKVKWPMEQIQIYCFHYVENDFQKVEQFLLRISSLTQQEHELYLESEDEHIDEKPVEYFMQLVAIWCNVYKQLHKLEDFQTHKRFEEPLARINLHLLLGMHDLRKKYRLDFELLDAICNRLYCSAVQGLFYTQCHDMIFNGLLNIFSKDYDLFYQKSTQTINFFYEAFSVEIRSLTHLKIYEELQKMLTENGASPDSDEVPINPTKINILINFLIEPHMLKVYYTTLLTKNTEKIQKKNIVKIQQEALKFLNVLQSKLLTLDCFSREFMESVLHLSLKNDANLSGLAYNLYITVLRRIFSEPVILKHILSFHAEYLDSIEYLKPCILNMYNSIPSLLNFNNILEIISDTNTLEIIRFLSAHMLVIVFEAKSEENDSTSKQEIENLLQILPELFENLQCQNTIGILLQVFSYTAIENLQRSTIDNFIHYAVGVFTHIEINLEYPLLMNIFNIFHKCLNFNHEWHHLELFSDHLITLYREMINELKKIDETQNEGLLRSSLKSYNSLLKRLNIIFKLKYDVVDVMLISLSQISKLLCQYFLYNSTIQNVIISEKSLIDVYALEISISCILKLTKSETEVNQNSSFFSDAQELLKYLWLRLQNLNNVFKMPVVRIKAYLSSLFHLYTCLPVKLENNVYHQMIQILIKMINTKSFNRKLADELQQIHPMQSMEYQRLMFSQFIEMHKCQQVQIDTNMVWKLCIYYRMSKHKFNEELRQLIITLGRYRFKIYKNIIAVLIYNLYNQQPALKYSTIKGIIKQHIHLIDNEIPSESPNILKIHVVLLVLQIIEKALNVQRIKLGHSRLEALRHLNIFIEDLDLIQLQSKQLIEQQLEIYENHLLTAEERKVLDDFKQVICSNGVC